MAANIYYFCHKINHFIHYGLNKYTNIEKYFYYINDLNVKKNHEVIIYVYFDLRS